MTRLSATVGFCDTCGEFYVDGHMPNCPDNAAGQPYTWAQAVSIALQHTGTTMGVEQVSKLIVKLKLRNVRKGISPRKSVQAALHTAATRPGSGVAKVSWGKYRYSA